MPISKKSVTVGDYQITVKVMTIPNCGGTYKCKTLRTFNRDNNSTTKNYCTKYTTTNKCSTCPK